MNEQTTIDRMQEYECQGKSCLYLSRLMKSIVSKDFIRVFIWCFFTAFSLMLGASIYNGEEGVISGRK